MYNIQREIKIICSPTPHRFLGMVASFSAHAKNDDAVRITRRVQQ